MEYNYSAIFLSTPSARRATGWESTFSAVHGNFYPRPPRGGRPAGWASAPDWRAISIHALREEGDWRCRRMSPPLKNFYPRPPRGGRLQPCGVPTSGLPISIHALREEGDRRTFLNLDEFGEFLSTPSARRATTAPSWTQRPSANFYPRPPRGGRQQKQRQNLYFQTNYTTFCTNLEEP